MSRLNAVSLFFGPTFGFLFCAAGFTQYDVIHRMLLLQNAAPYLVMASAVATALPVLWLLERLGWHTPLGGKLQPRRVPIERRHVLGGTVFGAGWALTGACPGTVSGMIGTGGLMGFVTLAGILVGIAARDRVAERPAMPHAEPAPQQATVTL